MFKLKNIQRIIQTSSKKGSKLRKTNSLNFSSQNNIINDLDFSGLKSLGDTTPVQLHSLYDIKEGVVTDSLYKSSSDLFLIDSFTENSHKGYRLDFLKKHITNQPDHSNFVDISFLPKNLETILSKNSFQILGLEDMLTNGILSVSSNAENSRSVFSKQKSKKTIWKRDKIDRDQYRLGLIGADWTNPLFKGSFAQAYSANINQFKHQIVENLFYSNNDKGILL